MQKTGIVLFLFFFTSLAVYAQLKPAVNQVMGTAKVKHKGTFKWIEIRRGENLYKSDAITTYPESTVQFNIADNMTFKLFENSTLDIKNLLDENDSQSGANIKLWLGMLMAVLNNTKSKDSSLKLSTPSVSITTKDSFFYIKVDNEGKTKICVKNGTVTCSSNDNTVTLRSNQVTYTDIKGLYQPIPVSIEDMTYFDNFARVLKTTFNVESDKIPFKEKQKNLNINIVPEQKTELQVTSIKPLIRGKNELPPVKKTVIVDRPDIVTGLSVTPLSEGGKLRITWDTLNELDASFSHYNIYRSISSNSGYKLLISGFSANKYTDTGLSNGLPYYYKVSAVNKDGIEGNKSLESSGIPVDNDPPDAPDNVTYFFNPLHRNLEIKWTQDNKKDVSFYTIYLFKDGQKQLIGQTNNSLFFHSDIKEKTPYTYLVTAWDRSGNESIDSKTIYFSGYTR